jgi:hypothetical protein
MTKGVVMKVVVGTTANQSRPAEVLLRKNLRWARNVLGCAFRSNAKRPLKNLTEQFGFSAERGDLQILDNSWYVTHTGLLGLAKRKKCCGIHVETENSLSDPSLSRYVMKATVYPSKASTGFVGYGDADPPMSRCESVAPRCA